MKAIKIWDFNVEKSRAVLAKIKEAEVAQMPNFLYYYFPIPPFQPIKNRYYFVRSAKNLYQVKF